MATAFKLEASAGPRPFVTSRTVTRASNDDAVCTNLAAGRACSPCGLFTVSVIDDSSAAADDGSGDDSVPVSPRCAIFPASPPRAS